MTSPTQSPVRLLLAEDNPVSRLLATTLLQQIGYQVQATNDGLEAVEALKQSPFDLVILDCQMPNMDGFAVARWIRASQLPNAKTIPVFAMTATTTPEESAKCIDSGMNSILEKPLRLDALRTALESALSASQKN